MILAQDTLEGREYFLVLSPNVTRKFKIIRINRSTDRDGREVCTSVSVVKDDNGGIIQISGGTVLQEIQGNSQVIEKQRTVSRSSVIDKLLAKISLEEEPEWEELYNNVVKKYGGSEKDRVNILSQAKERWGWYKRGIKVNPYLQLVEKEPV